jgi:hypothetical protein
MGEEIPPAVTMTDSIPALGPPIGQESSVKPPTETNHFEVAPETAEPHDVDAQPTIKPPTDQAASLTTKLAGEVKPPAAPPYYRPAETKSPGPELPTITELVVPAGTKPSTYELNNGLGSAKPSLPDIRSHIIAKYGIEAQRKRLEEELHLRQIQLEKEKDAHRLVPGLDDDDFDALLRSFDKVSRSQRVQLKCQQVQDVHIAPPPYDGHIPRGLDLQPSPNEQFSTLKLTSALERFYSSIVVGLIRTLQEVQRIRHWEDGGHRTVIALAVRNFLPALGGADIGGVRVRLVV